MAGSFDAFGARALTVARGQREGRIVTFYSYKGGVGRTMALANVAFMAANQGHRVLVMDWDLEAPGLPYYFRGLLEAPDFRALKESRGLLDLVWDWTSSLQKATTAAETKAVFHRFDKIEYFQSYVRPIVSPDLWETGCLDFINAGAPSIQTSVDVFADYGDALANFSWPAFFSDFAGGSVLENLRRWAKENYDYILIDSRTGLADVSGICTTQMPDAVALCFVLNRQNIDGVARVASSIRRHRNDKIELMAVPMRVAANGRSEEDDARARGIYELTKIGGFSEDAVTDDFRILPVRAADNVPYYETLAPVIATDPPTDPLTLNYVRLASRVLGTPIQPPVLAPEWLETVRRRLQPRHATIEYVAKLTAADPARATAELEVLIESAFDTIMDGVDLRDDYVTALVEACFFLASRADEPLGAVDMLHRLLDLLRALAAVDTERWRDFLALAIERNLEAMNFYLDRDEELALLEELDGLLTDANTVAMRLRRLQGRMRAARLYIQREDFEVANQTVGQGIRLIREINSGKAKLAADQKDQLVTAQAEAGLFRGDIAERQSDWSKAMKEYVTALRQLEGQDSDGKAEFARVAFELHNRLSRAPAELMAAEEAANHAVMAARFGASFSVAGLVTNLIELARVVTAADDHPLLALRFCENIFSTQDRRVFLQNANYWGRTPRAAIQFIEAVRDLARLAGRAEPGAPALTLLGESANLVWRSIERRRHTIGRLRDHLSEPLRALAEALAEAAAPAEVVAQLQESAASAAARR